MYVKEAIAMVEDLLVEDGEGKVLKSSISNPFSSNYRPELDVSMELGRTRVVVDVLWIFVAPTWTILPGFLLHLNNSPKIDFVFNFLQSLGVLQHAKRDIPLASHPYAPAGNEDHSHTT